MVNESPTEFVKLQRLLGLNDIFRTFFKMTFLKSVTEIITFYDR